MTVTMPPRVRVLKPARRVLGVLVEEAGENDLIQISYPKIARRANVAERWMGSHVTRLEAAGYIEILPSKVGEFGTPTTTYRILPAGREFAARQGEAAGSSMK
jgi:DNA-binding MarR family transcriptional regulator